MRTKRDAALKKNDQYSKRRVTEQKVEQDREVLAIDRDFKLEQREMKERHEARAQETEDQHTQMREDDHHWHAQNWTALLREWKSACDLFTQACRAIAKEADHWFPDWSKPLVLPTALPRGLPLGRMQWSLDMFPDGMPTDPQLPRPDLSKTIYPALVPFPQQASILFRAHGDGKAAGVDALQAILLRAWTSMPAGKVRCTIIDPIGRGENFSAFMHLADHEERLVDGRIWTETVQIDERMTNLTVHMENVLQKYLRNQFKTLAEYNEQAGEVAEPFHFLVVANFPVNFSEDAARRLVSLASAGARCGVFTLLMVDSKAPLPHGFNIADLENVSICLDWHKDRFVWEDEDFGMFPLELEKPPESERCTEILRQVGDEAVRSSKVEVPFEWIMPRREEWWSGSSADDIKVPIGRFGAQGKQFLEFLGHGTSQHVLVAGKTGSGKSTLLHVLITQLAMYYNPGAKNRALPHRFQEGGRRVQGGYAPAWACLMPASSPEIESEPRVRAERPRRAPRRRAVLSRRGEFPIAPPASTTWPAYREASRKHPEPPELAAHPADRRRVPGVLHRRGRQARPGVFPLARPPGPPRPRVRHPCLVGVANHRRGL